MSSDDTAGSSYVSPRGRRALFCDRVTTPVTVLAVELRTHQEACRMEGRQTPQCGFFREGAFHGPWGECQSFEIQLVCKN